jgi:hypothetical protein
MDPKQPFEVGGECLQSLPCIHKVRLTPHEEWKDMNAYDIKKLYEKYDLPIPEHFQVEEIKFVEISLEDFLRKSGQTLQLYRE